MTTRSLHDCLFVEQNAVLPQTISQSASPDGVVGQDIDVRDYDSLLLALLMGDIDEMGSSPVGAADIQVLTEHADDNDGSPGTYEACPQRCIDGQTVDESGVFIVGGDDTQAVSWGVITEKRWVRVTLLPVGLTNGGLVAVVALQGHAHLEPVPNT